MQRKLLLVASFTVMALVAAFAWQPPEAANPQRWASKAKAETPTVAVLLEFGVKDVNIRDWSGRAIVDGAKVVKRQGYRFRSGDKLHEPEGWEAFSHRAIRVPKGQPAVAKLEPIASVGVVLHLQDVKDNAGITIRLNDGDTPKGQIGLKDVLGGKKVSLWGGEAVARLLSTATPIATGPNEEDHPAAAYGPDGTLWVAYISYKVREDERRIEPPMLKQQPENFKQFFTPEYGDQLMVRFFRLGKWSPEIPLTEAKEDLARCAIGVDGQGWVYAIYSPQRNGNFDIYYKTLFHKALEGKQEPDTQFGREERLTTNPGPDLNPVVCTDAAGDLWLAFQSWSPEGQGRIAVYKNRNAVWTEQAMIRGAKGETCWHPAIAADHTGKVAVACDIYKDNSDYDVHVAVFDIATSKRSDHVVANSARFEARPALAYDKAGRLWIAYEEGPEQWGKDYGALAPNKGNPLYNERSVRVVCLDNGKLMRPAAELPTSKYDPPVLPFEPEKTHKYERTTRYAYPKIGVDLEGRVWLAYRRNFGSRYSSHPGSYWLTFVRRLDGDAWTEPVEVHHSDGLLDHRPVLLPHVSGGILVVHNTDGRYTTPEVINNEIHAGVVQVAGKAAEPRLVAAPLGKRQPNRAAEQDRAAVQRIKNYRIDAGGKKYQILRGEFHRHTEISWDGGPDGSLEDMFRYAIDVAGMDWIGNGDHDSGAGREYSWWLIQKFSDAYHVPGAFTPMFTYERSVAYPHGHRNCMFAKRGVRTLPGLRRRDAKDEGGVHPGDTKMLYRYLKELGGICAVH